MALKDLLERELGNSKPRPTGGLSGLLEKTVKEPTKSVDSKGRMVFKVGEGLNEVQKEKAREVISNPVIPVGQEIKVPFMQKGIVVPSGDGVGAGYSALKTFIETPEKGLRSLLEFGGISKQSEEKQWRVPSYAETAGKNVGQLIDEGVPPAAAVILGSAEVAGHFANDALIFEQIFGSAFRSIGTKVVKDEAQTLAYDLLGRPKTLKQAEKNWRKMQMEFHPDISGSDLISKQANNAINVLRKTGIPSSSILSRGANALFNRPINIFKKPTVSPTPTTTPDLLPERTLSDKFSIKAEEPTVLKFGETPATKPSARATKQIVTSDPEVPKEIEIQPKKEVVKVPGDQLPVGEGATKVTRLEARMKEKLDSVNPERAKEEGLSTFEQMNKKDQIAKASEYVAQNPDEALEVLKGNLPAPKGLLHNSIALALETQAELIGSADLVSKLASLRSTRFGQEISILTETDPLNVVSKTREIEIVRERAIAKRSGKKLPQAKADTKTEVEKIMKEEQTLAQIKVEEAEKLLDSLIC